MPEWNKLPAELQEMIVKRSNKDTRNSLRVCSKKSKLLVEETRFRSLYYLGIRELNERWIIDTKQSRYHQNLQTFANFEELQADLMQILKSTGCIEHLAVSLPISTPPIKLINEKDPRRLLLVESVLIDVADSVQQENILSKIEPVYLKAITLESDAQNSRIYDMEQVIHAENLKVYGRSCIREDQLLKLNAYNIYFTELTCSIREYIEQCALKTGTRMRIFQFGASSISVFGLSNLSTEVPFNRLVLDVPNSKLKFEITVEKREDERGNFVKAIGNLRYESESNKSNFWRCDRSLLRIIRCLRISYEDGSWNITLASLSFRLETYQFQKFGEFQEKMDEIMENVDFIKHFSIKLTGTTERMGWDSRNDKKLMVRKLIVEGDNDITSVRNLLEQIDPKFLMDVTIDKNENLVENRSILKMPQIRNASRVKIPISYLGDKDLLAMNQFFFSTAVPDNASGTDEVDQLINRKRKSSPLTVAGINQFVKKCVGNVGKTPINFNLGKLMHLKKSTELFNVDGLEAIGYCRNGDNLQIIINSNHPDYVMNLIFGRQLQLSGFVSHRDKTHTCHPFRVF